MQPCCMRNHALSPAVSPSPAASPCHDPVLVPGPCGRGFLLQPGPGTGLMQCVVTRQRTGAKLFPEYTLHLEACSAFLLAARKRKKSASTHYLLSSDSQARRAASSFPGRVPGTPGNMPCRVRALLLRFIWLLWQD